MPARSRAQQRYLEYRFGHRWVRRHHFDTSGPLPERASSGKRQSGKRKRKR